MGFRTVVMFNNDLTHEWSNDPKLGEKIRRAMDLVGRKDDYGYSLADIGYGQVVECTHADNETLAILDSYTGFQPVAYSHWRPHDSNEVQKLRLLKEMAENMGYSLRKKPTK